MAETPEGPLPNGTTADCTTAAVLIDHVPKAERPGFLIQLVQSLEPEDTTSTIFVASLLARDSSEDTEAKFLSFLEGSIQNSQIDTVVKLCSQYPRIGDQLIARAVQAIAKAKSNAESTSVIDDSLRSYLLFSRSVISGLPTSPVHGELFDACLELLAGSNDNISKSAMDVVLTMVTTSDTVHGSDSLASHHQKIWQTVQEMTVSRNKSRAISGYSLWLRYLLSRSPHGFKDLITPNYWQLLLHGLRHGDSERRKLCLNIIKLSIAADLDAVSDTVRQQYERYCTVFETIVLGRYINQIQECEGDLDALVETRDLDIGWLYVLLASALDPQMQESNRKFIGTWIMRSNLQPSLEFLEFFKRDFLPWTIQGQLFVSSLRRVDGVLRCGHGNSLAAFVKRLRQNATTEVVNTVVDTIHHRCNTIFAYAVVYLMEGVADSLDARHLEKIAEVRGLPEVARDYIQSRASTLNLNKPQSKTSSRRETMEQGAIEKNRNFDGDMSALEDIWADLDYLEFPKRLLMALPPAMLRPKMIRHAIENPDVADSLAEKLEILQNVSSTKVFLFAPLVTAVRHAIITNPDASRILPLPDFIVRIVEKLPEATVDLMLEEATVPLTPFQYSEYFGDPPSFGFAALFDLTTRLHEHQHIIEAILHNILSKWKAQKVPPPTVSAWKNTTQLQLLMICFEQYDITTNGQVEELLNDLFHVLAIEPLPRYRYLLEATIVRLIIRYELLNTVIERLHTKDHHSNPKHLASLMKIGTILARLKGSSVEFAMELATSFVPLAASSKVVIRHEAQWQIPILMDHARSKEWSTIHENPALASLDGYIRSLERFNDPPLERRIGTFNPETDLTLSNLVEGRWFDLDEMGSPIISHEDFIKLYQADPQAGIPARCIPLGDKIPQRHPPQTDPPPDSKPILGPRTATESTALQTKGTAYLSRTLADPTTHPHRPHDLIVVGSLVDNPYNLGGLSRVAEIFGASALTLQNQNVLGNKDFTSVSVSSHLHFPIVQLSAGGVPGFLAERKREGWTVVGIEQTDRSVMLGGEGCRLPGKVVLVVGSEREGIPAAVLTECEVLVEVPQAGITRSLNVQTAVAIVLFEYARQRRAGA